MTETLLNYGGVGILAVALLIAVRVLFAQVQKDKQRESDRADRNEEALRKMTEKTVDQVIGTLSQTVTALQETNRLLPELQIELRAGRQKRDV